MGCIALSGIVVRNSIILIDYINEKRRAGSTPGRGRARSGRAAAAADFPDDHGRGGGRDAHDSVGSSLWSPLASVLASGLVFSMFFVFSWFRCCSLLSKKKEATQDAHLPCECSVPCLRDSCAWLRLTLQAQSARKIHSSGSGRSRC